MDIDIKKIELTGWNPRKDFNKDALAELAQSIKEVGILQPIVVRKKPDTKKDVYQLIAGERRLRAAKLAKLETIPAMVREMTDRVAKEIMLLENLQREDLQPIEEAKAITVLLDEGLTQGELADRIGKSQSWIANRLRLLKAPDEVKKMVKAGAIAPRHVMELLKYEKYAVFKPIMEAIDDVLDTAASISVKQLETLIEDQIDDYGNNGKYVLDLDSMPWASLRDDVTIRDAMEEFDRKPCKKCKDKVKVTQPSNEKHDICLNKDCWKEKLNEGKRKVLEKRGKAAEKVDTNVIELWKKNKVKIYDIPYQSRRDLKGRIAVLFMDDCVKCEHYGNNPKQYALCFNPECYDRKAKTAREALELESETDTERTMAGIKGFLESDEASDPKHLRSTLEYINEQDYRDLLSKTFTMMGIDHDLEEMTEAMNAVKDKDLLRVVIGAGLVFMIDDCHHTDDVDGIKKAFPMLKPFIPRKTKAKKPEPAEEPAKSPRHRADSDLNALCGAKKKKGGPAIIVTQTHEITCPECLELMKTEEPAKKEAAKPTPEKPVLTREQYWRKALEFMADLDKGDWENMTMALEGSTGKKWPFDPVPWSKGDWEEARVVVEEWYTRMEDDGESKKTKPAKKEAAKPKKPALTCTRCGNEVIATAVNDCDDCGLGFCDECCMEHPDNDGDPGILCLDCLNDRKGTKKPDPDDGPISTKPAPGTCCPEMKLEEGVCLGCGHVHKKTDVDTEPAVGSGVKVFCPDSHIWKKLKRVRKDLKCEICGSTCELWAYRAQCGNHTVCKICLDNARAITAQPKPAKPAEGKTGKGGKKKPAAGASKAPAAPYKVGEVLIEKKWVPKTLLGGISEDSVVQESVGVMYLTVQTVKDLESTTLHDIFMQHMKKLTGTEWEFMDQGIFKTVLWTPEDGDLAEKPKTEPEG